MQKEAERKPPKEAQVPQEPSEDLELWQLLERQREERERRRWAVESFLQVRYQVVQRPVQF